MPAKTEEAKEMDRFYAEAEEDMDAWEDLVLVLDALQWRGIRKADEFRFKLKTWTEVGWHRRLCLSFKTC